MPAERRGGALLLAAGTLLIAASLARPVAAAATDWLLGPGTLASAAGPHARVRDSQAGRAFPCALPDWHPRVACDALDQDLAGEGDDEGVGGDGEELDGDADDGEWTPALPPGHPPIRSAPALPPGHPPVGGLPRAAPRLGATGAAPQWI